ncbi:uncharacterized protein Dana_GF11113, isoform E [Drosophila ananassae]|uniref:Uncharacterized protein, isoform A n=1 Tax=Drosophila ananassae TaxID=7217 RepID=B3MI27_DROAN|nr:uncharacterized protein LOC6493978 [Drosophila ananassae]XP_014762504.1 uncharacterized protein LOC6493978 [Drosophila ananassae]XP_044571700.1 uncharacterized protein LOC6493978 [Drosophila ananassae]XP_044571701.1 uncharacterized protein LOC6493978 [Drosophila ananassae]EDV38037.1 uncharacterized protein Dana_GF11113, isoform A [Drosophila ananassae]KPU77227.1 uncharacterized protein Dana_GF11113, isoform B [Drosophila ananassae]KPU77228.1 uncharacterized protein Dana_GF11113, isoform C 
MTAAKRRAGSSGSSSGSSSSSGSNIGSNGSNDQQSQQQHHQLQHHHQAHQHHQEYQQLLQHPHHHYHQHYSSNGQHNHSATSHPQQYHQRQQQHQQQQHHHHQQHQATLRDCSVKLPLDILWLPKSAMRPAGPDTSPTDCILVVGVSRPKLAVVFLTVMLISLFLTFHVLYDSAVYNIQAAQAVHERHRLSLASSSSALPSASQSGGIMSSSGLAAASPLTSSSNHQPVFVKPVQSSNQLSHPMVFPSSRVHFPKTSRRLPQALIIGVRKCGTRALLEMLYLHPRIQKAGGEVHFFDRDENYLKGLEWYRKKMPHSFRGQITIEKSPSYFVSPEVPERVRAMNASIKLLLIVREPVTRAISDYTQLRSHAATAILPLAEPQNANPNPSPRESSGGGATGAGGAAAAKMPSPLQSQSLLYGKLQSARGYDNALLGGSGAGAKETKATTGPVARRPAGGGGGGGAASMATTTLSPLASAAQMAAKSFEELAIFPNGTVNEAYRPLSISMYHVHLHRWLEVFPREQLLVVNGDRLIEDPVSQLKRIEAFLGIEHRVKSEHFYFNETKGFYCLRYDNGDRCLRETKGRKHPHVDPVVVSRLRKFFAEYNQRFYELVGEDLGWPEE